MRTVLGKTAGRAGLILVTAGVVGSAALPAVPAAAVTGNPRASVHDHRSEVRIGHAVKYVRDADGTVHRVR